MLVEETDIYSLPADEPNLDTIYDREQLAKQSKLTLDINGDSIAPHLEEPAEDVEDTYGPVPPSIRDTESGPYADPYNQDWSVLPTQRS